MQKIIKVVLLLSFICLTGPLVWANSASDAIKSFSMAGESGEYFKTAYGYVVFPTIGKAGFVVGGAYGKGPVFVNAKQVGTADMTQLTAGFQLGGQAYSQIIFFENEQAFKHFSSGNFEFSAQATAVAITAGVSAEANTGGGAAASISGGRNDANTVHAGYRKGMAIFTIAKGGLMGEAVVGGQKFTYTALPAIPVESEPNSQN
ncbi:MAG: lipid-binding SYLF domain-containing protein [Halioglobus sp.]|jgi:lipid-binding SYLF domain-containing protein